MTLPLPLATTLGVMRVMGSTVTEHGDHVTLASPQVPGHRWGEAVLVRDPTAADDVARWTRTCAGAGMARPVIGLPVRPTPGAWEAVPVPPNEYGPLELRVDTWAALVAREVRPAHPLPAAFTVRPCESDADWDSLAFSRADQYLPEWTTSQRRATEGGRLAMFVAALGEVVVSAAGVALCEVGGALVGRFQDVSTDPVHQRQGLASHVIGAAHAWARARGATSTVIVADPDKEAIRLYEELGFTRAEDAWMVLPYPRRTG